MVKINRIYTRTGDDGTTGLVGTRRVRKDSLRIKAVGEIDEVNAFLGMARTLESESSHKADTSLLEKLERLQHELFDLGAEIATDPNDTKFYKIAFDDSHIKRLEEWIDILTSPLEELKSFVLPGGTVLNALFHQCRVICRRAERSLLELQSKEKVSEPALRYINRLSDTFFAMARFESHRAGAKEYLWKPGK